VIENAVAVPSPLKTLSAVAPIVTVVDAPVATSAVQISDCAAALPKPDNPCGRFVHVSEGELPTVKVTRSAELLMQLSVSTNNELFDGVNADVVCDTGPVWPTNTPLTEYLSVAASAICYLRRRVGISQPSR
jgi:hypothetical protein